MTAHSEPFSPDDRQTLERWRRQYRQNWSEESLRRLLDWLPLKEPLGVRGLVELACLDLWMRRQRGIAASVESYLMLYPELGTAETAPLELLLTEWHARDEEGERPKLTEFANRFPRRMAELRDRLGKMASDESDEAIQHQPKLTDWVVGRRPTHERWPKDHLKRRSPSFWPTGPLEWGMFAFALLVIFGGCSLLGWAFLQSAFFTPRP